MRIRVKHMQHSSSPSKLHRPSSNSNSTPTTTATSTSGFNSSANASCQPIVNRSVKLDLRWLDLESLCGTCGNVEGVHLNTPYSAYIKVSFSQSKKLSSLREALHGKTFAELDPAFVKISAAVTSSVTGTSAVTSDTTVIGKLCVDQVVRDTFSRLEKKDHLGPKNAPQGGEYQVPGLVLLRDFIDAETEATILRDLAKSSAWESMQEEVDVIQDTTESVVKRPGYHGESELQNSKARLQHEGFRQTLGSGGTGIYGDIQNAKGVSNGHIGNSGNTANINAITAPTLAAAKSESQPQSESHGRGMSLNAGQRGDKSPSLTSSLLPGQPQLQPQTQPTRRRVMHYGYKFDYQTRHADCSTQVPWPAWRELSGLGTRVNIAVRKAIQGKLEWTADQATVNEYVPGEGIAKHIDTHAAFEDGIASLSLGSMAVIRFATCTKEGKKDEHFVDVVVPRRSLFIMTGESRYLWTHAMVQRTTDKVDGKIVYRGTRLSVTYRHVKKPPSCDCNANAYIKRTYCQ